MLDVSKGVAILSILFIHAALCSGPKYLPLSVGSVGICQFALLFDAPLFFFLSGWAATYSQNTVRRVIGRMIKLYVPYALMILFFTLCISVFFKETVAPSNVLRWLALDDLRTEGLPVVLASMWFFVTYLMIYATTPLLARIYRNGPVAIFLIALLALANAIFTINNVPLDAFIIYPKVTVQIFLFYLLFYFLGMFLHDRAITAKQFIVLFTVALSLFFIYWPGYNFNLGLQLAKFPPTTCYLVASLFSVLIVLYARNFENGVSRLVQANPLGKFLSYSGRNVFDIYLCQGFASSLPTLVLPFLLGVTLDWRPIFVIDLALILLVTYPMARVFGAISGRVLSVLALAYDGVLKEVHTVWLEKS